MFKKADIPYSLKNIPIPDKDSFLKSLLSKTEQFIQRLRWKTFFFLNPDIPKPNIKTFGFKTEKSAPQVKELSDFENDLYSVIEKLEFSRHRSQFQKQLLSDVEKIKNSKDVFILGDKTPNVYEVNASEYNKLLHNSINTHYKKAADETELNINREARDIAKDLELDDRIDKLTNNECYITLKDHKDQFQNRPKVRLINPAKSNIGQISKVYLQEINDRILEKTKLHQWKSTSEVIKWFNNIANKSRCSFLSLDVVDFYPSISAELLEKAIEFAETQTHIAPHIIQTIKNARKSLLFNEGVAWQKKTGLSDVTQGGLDSCQVCELVGLYLLHQMREKFPALNFGLYRDDGLAVHKRIPGPQLERCKKDITGLFRNNGLEITISTGLKSVDFLDVTFNLTTETYQPYTKPNNELLYVNKQSNHPPTVLSQIPNSVNERLNNISSNETVFNDAKGKYERALEQSGYNTHLSYKNDCQTQNQSTRKNRKRQIIWYNPPYSLSLKTNFGSKFLHLLNKHFPRQHKLHKIINKNNVKLSYSTTKNMKRIIQSHNNKILNKKEKSGEKTCSCPATKKDNCPLQHKCLSKCIVYKATVKKSNKFYLGISQNDFKSRLAKHKSSFRHEKEQHSTALSTHCWQIGETPEPEIEWQILKQSTPRVAGSKECQLCLEEKLQILKQNGNSMCLNKRSELSNRCFVFHRAKHKLASIK